MRVVSNTTPILSLIKIDKLNLLHDLYGRITVPEAVYREVMAGYDKEYLIDLRDFDWITVEAISSAAARLAFPYLDDGEAEAIVLALDHPTDWVIIDEKSGRKTAEQLNLHLIGTVGVLVAAKERGLITAIAPYLAELKERQSWMSKSLLQTVLEQAGEAPS